MEEELFDFNFADLIPKERKARVKEESIHPEEVERVIKRCEELLGKAQMIIQYHLMHYDEMNLVFKMESYFERNKHLGVHWYKQLQRLVRKYMPSLVERQVKDRLLE